MKVEVLLLEFGVQANLFLNNKLIDTILGVSLANLCQSVYSTYKIDIFGEVGLN